LQRDMAGLLQGTGSFQSHPTAEDQPFPLTLCCVESYTLRQCHSSRGRFPVIRKRQDFRCKLLFPNLWERSRSRFASSAFPSLKSTSTTNMKDFGRGRCPLRRASCASSTASLLNALRTLTSATITVSFTPRVFSANSKARTSSPFGDDSSLQL